MSVGLANPPPLSACEDPGPGTHRQRWAFWRSPPGQPAWARPALLGIAAVAAALYARNLAGAGLAPLYSTAVKSMSESWKAFFYGAFDPRATITIDKLAGSFLPQALSARIFGFHPWSLALPQVIEGVISVLVMYRVVRRWAGVVPGLLVAAIFTLTPITASMFGHSMEDGALTMCLVLAADSYQRAVIDARLRSLIWSGVWVGLGFQAKILEAWMILPALALGYLLSAPAPLRRRLGQLAVAGSVMLAVSLSWIALYTFTPAADRPYIDGSTTNSAAAMTFGYNGLERFGILVPGAVTSGPGLTVQTGPAAGVPVAEPAGPGAPGGRPAGGPGAPGGPPAAGPGSPGGWANLADPRYGPEIGWLYPLALLTLAFGLQSRWRAGRTDRLRGGLVMWGTWLLTFGVVYSRMDHLPHTAYLAPLAPPIAALGGAGVVMFWRWFTAGDPRGWVLPVAVAAELAWAAYLWSGHRTFLPWVLPGAVALGAVAIVAMVAALIARRPRTRLAVAGLAVGALAVFAAPAAWALSVLDPAYAGNSFDATAGPAGEFRASAELAGIPVGELTQSGGPGGILASARTMLDGTEQGIYRYVSAHRAGASYLMAVPPWMQASPYILATGQEVLPFGGFSGTVPEPTLSHVRQLVHTGQLRFFLLGGGFGTGPGPGGSVGGGSQAQQIIGWVKSACAQVPAQDYGGAAGGGSGIIYECGKNT